MSAWQPEPLTTLRAWLAAQDWTHLSPLSALLDAHLIFGEQGLALEAMGPLFQRWWPGASLRGAVDDCAREGLVSAVPGGRLAVPAEVQGALSEELERWLGELPVALSGETVCLAELLDDFADYRAQALGLAGQPGRRHLMLSRPLPLYLKAHPDAFILLFCRLPEDGWPAIAEGFVASASLRARVAIYDLGSGYKANLTRSELAVYFERYLQREWGLRLAPAPAFSQALIDGGLLSLRQG